jgi:4-amino-4-deoxy-L-arabinose transferase-like glycosyltransferase
MVSALSKPEAHEADHDWLTLALASFLITLVAFGAGGLWRPPLIYDEFTYYYPALQAYATHFSEVWLNPPFPGPPTGLILQLPVYFAFHGSMYALRAYSTLATAAMAIVLFWHLRRVGTSMKEAVHLLMIMCSMFVLFPAFIFKHHAFMLLFLLAGLVLWERVVVEGGSRRLLVAASVLLTLAITTNQLVAPVCFALAFETWLTRARPASIPWTTRAAAALAPLVVLSLFFLSWRGTMPPAYRANSVVQSVNFGTLHPAQIFACFLTLGLWVAPSLGFDRKSIARSAALALPFAIGFYLWGGYGPTVPFFDSIVGPISSVLRFVAARSLVASAVIGGAICGVGAEMLLRSRGAGMRWIAFEVFIVAYLGMMLLVPYLFEGYYFIPFVVACLFLRDKMGEVWPSPWVVAHKSLVIVVGLVYALYKVTSIAV